MKIRLASPADAAAIERVETGFCTPRNLPPEKQDGVIEFIDAGGRIFLCEDQGEIHSAFWIIMVENLARIDGRELVQSSPLRALIRSGIVASLAARSFCVFSWTPLTRRGIWLYRFLRRLGASHYRGARIMGFVATGDRGGTQRYLRMGCKIISTLPALYSQNDSHHLLEYVVEGYARKTTSGQSVAPKHADEVETSLATLSRQNRG